MTRLLKASDIQPPDDPSRQNAEKWEKAIRDALIAMFLSLGSIFGSQAALRMIQRYNAPDLARLLNSREVQDLFVTGYQPVADAFLEAARRAANDNLMGLAPYDPLAAAAPLQALRDQLAQRLVSQARDTIRAALLSGLRAGVNPAIIGANLQQVIGLDAQQVRAVANYRRLLEGGDVTALRRALRDKTFDRALERAIRGGAPLKAEQIDAMVAAYAKRSLEYRAERMAATEAMQASVSGMRDAYVQAVDSGRMLDSEVRRFWLTAGDELVCPSCSSVPLLNPEGVGVNEMYKTSAGPVLEPILHPWCRCSERYVANLSRLTEQPFRLAA